MSTETKTTNDRFEFRNDESTTTFASRGTKRPLNEMAASSNALPQRGDDEKQDDDDWNSERDEFIRKIKEIKKLKARDVNYADRMRVNAHQRKSDHRHLHYYMDERLETIKEFAEPSTAAPMGEGAVPPPPPPRRRTPPRQIQVPSLMQKTHSQIVRCRIPVNVAKASPTPPTSAPARSVMYQRLQSEHLQLQRSFALLKQLVAESCGSQHQDKANLSKLEEEKKILLQTTKQLQYKVKDLQEKLNEYQEQNELLEFRILELDCLAPKGLKSPDVRENGSNTDYCSGSSASNGQSDDDEDHVGCFDSFDDQIAKCQDLDLQVDSLQEELGKIASLPGLTCYQRKAIAHSASCVRKCKRELVMLWSRVNNLSLQMGTKLEGKGQRVEKCEGILRSRKNDTLDIEDILKNLHKLETELSEEDESDSLTESQIREMDSSKTESELDMSLTPESEAPSLVHADNGGLCFDCTVAKEGVRNLTRRMRECTMVNHPHLEPRSFSSPTKAYESGLTPSEDEGLGDDHSRRDGYSTGPTSLTDFDSPPPPAKDQSEDDLTEAEERRRLQSRVLSLSRSLRLTEEVVAQLRTELSSKEDQISQLMSDNCPNTSAKTILELEERLSICDTNRAELQEQVLELEEAENDARLESQNLMAMVDNLKRNEVELEGQLDAARSGLDNYESQILAMEASDEELRTQISYLESLVFKYEEHVSDLEKNEAELRRKLMELEAEKEEKNRVLIKDLRDVEVEAAVPKTNRETQTEDADATIRSENSGNLLDRLLTLEAKDGQLRDQLHQMDSANLKLWQKLRDLNTNLDICRKMDDSAMEIDENRGPTERLDDLLLSVPPSAEDCTSPPADCLTPTVVNAETTEGPPSLLRESKLRERLRELEDINRDFEKELGIREKLCRKKESECREWAVKEGKINSKIESLRQEEESLMNRMNDLESQKRDLELKVETLEREKTEMERQHCDVVDGAKRQHEETVNELKSRLVELETTEESHSSRIRVLEGRNLMDRSGFDVNERQAACVRDELSGLKTEQTRLRTLIVMQSAEVQELVETFKREIDTMVRKHSQKEQDYEQEIFALREREEYFRLQISELAEQRLVLEKELTKKKEELESVKRDFDKKMLLLEEEHHLVENELKWKLKEMEDGTNVAVKALEAKRKQLELSLQDDLKDLRIKEDSYKGRIKQLEKHVDTLRQEVTSIASNSSYEINQLLEPHSHAMEDTFETEGQSLGERITELEKKEAAYLETLENADRIIHRMEQSYKQKIDDLESTERSLRTKISQLEENESMLKDSLQSERKGTEGWKVSDLVKELMEAEARENTLKEHADEIEASLKNFSQKAKELERTNRQLREELREHDELLANLNSFKEKHEASKDEIAKLKQSESALKETLRHADSLLVQREMGLVSKVDELEMDKREMNEVLEQLRLEVKVLNEKLETIQFEKSVLERTAFEKTDQSQLEIRVSELEAVESDLRLEVTRLRQCLSASNAHLSDLETVRRNQDCTIETLEEEKNAVLRKLEQREKVSTLESGKIEASDMSARHIKECQEQMENQQTAQAFLLQRVAQLENALKFHQARLQSDSSIPLDSLESPVTRETPVEEASPVPMMVDDDVFTAGIEERRKLEECVSRAMEAMERDLKHNQNLPNRLSVSSMGVGNEPCLTSPNSPSTSGCESDAGSECCRSNEEEGWESDHSENFPGDSPSIRTKLLHLPKKHVVKSKELPSPVKTRVIYPTFSKTAVQEEAIMLSGHSHDETDGVLSPVKFHDIPEPPNNFQILRQVGKDSLLVGWSSPIRFSRVQCYKIFVNNQLHQHVRSPDRTKALLHKLDLAMRTEPFSISIQTVSLDGQLSRPASVVYDFQTFTPLPEKETATHGEK